MDLFALNNALSVLADTSCSECGWHGTNDELDPFPGGREDDSYYQCPDCAAYVKSTVHHVQDYGQVDIDDFLRELLDATLAFNREQVKGDHRYRAMFEVDMHGNIEFNVLDMVEFNKGHDNADKWYLLADKEETGAMLDRPGYPFDYTIARDWVDAFSKLVKQLDRAAKRKLIEEQS